MHRRGSRRHGWGEGWVRKRVLLLHAEVVKGVGNGEGFPSPADYVSMGELPSEVRGETLAVQDFIA